MYGAKSLRMLSFNFREFRGNTVFVSQTGRIECAEVDVNSEAVRERL